MKTKLFLLAAAIAAVGALTGPAVAAAGHAPVLDREQLTTWYAAPSSAATTTARALT